jgi:hypothetical protein
MTPLRTLIVSIALLALASSPSDAQAHRASGHLASFRTDAELARYLEGIIEARKAQYAKVPHIALKGAFPAAAGVVVTAAAAADESVTNTQHQGVDEGGIVKLHGDYLVMLRRGRLFTVDIGDRSLRPIAAVDAFGPGIDPRAAWYDELLVYGDKVVVVGYSYERGGTEIGVFHIDRAGGLRYLSTYQLRSNDYYSSRNYASRLVDGKLVFYTPLNLGYRVQNVLDALPAMHRWHGDTSTAGFERIVTPRHVYRPAHDIDPSSAIALHTVTTCDLTTEELECSASVVVGPQGRVFYVSPTSVYVWVSEWNGQSGREEGASTLYRMPLDGSAPSAIAASGSPVDQFSFLEGEDGFLDVVVRAQSGGDAMWRARMASGALALLRLPLESFGDGSRMVPWFRYTVLPTPSGGDFQNRFVGDHLLYGTGNGWGRPRTASSDLYVVGLAKGDVNRLELAHGTDRIEVMGSEAVVIGANGPDLLFSGIALGDRPSVVQRYTLAGASQGELRSHGFFYKPDGAESGVIGLPVRGPERPGYSHLREGSTSVLFLRNAGRDFTPMGELGASPVSQQDDACRASCVDWYGNARPLFARGRVFALLGYELVEGAIGNGRIREIDRVSYAPRVIHALMR